MESAFQRGVDWKGLFARPGFPYLFAGMFISLFGTGMNFHGVTWYVLGATGSTVQVSFLVILVTLPGLIVPPFGGVLIDRVDRRYLTMTLDLLRGGIVLSVAALAQFGRVEVWHLYAMVLLLGIGFSIYWSTLNALVQEVVPAAQQVGANAAVLIAVQGGMMAAGGLVGFVYQHAGIAGILAIDGATYLGSAFCLSRLRRGYFHPSHSFHPEQEEPPSTIEAPLPAADRQAVLPAIVEPGLVMGFVADLQEGLRYLRTEPRVLATGITYAFMMAGVLSANVLVVVLARNVLHAGPVGYGYLESGWAIGAVLGGAATGLLTRHFRPAHVLLVVLTLLAVGHAVFPYIYSLVVAVAMQAVFGGCRALGGVLTQSSILTAVPRRLMGRIQSAFSVISTLLQVAMSFTLGWLAEHVNLPVAFAALAMIYSGAVLAAMRAAAHGEQRSGLGAP